MPHHRILLTVISAATVALALTGCSAIEGAVYQRHSATYDDVGALADSELTADWIPSDATNIRTVASTREKSTDVVVLLDSAATLDPTVCAEIDRQSGPTLAIDGAPDVYALDTAFACGEWTVAQADGGWYGWTPNHPDEQAQSPGQ
ncbi:hypothetical protein GCM10009775_36610 [Microbacterium aoyamense]|uniref:Lipoprotein n=1 Tax=Microbacterium aoyamense TaxID=344166 RepID=A0ABN2Q2E7_9MICO|nr:hypothetical protein [Microbacterium aoyamense]